MKQLLVMIFFYSIFNSSLSHACTSFIIKTTNDHPFYGRTLEWSDRKFNSHLTIIPRKHRFTSYLPGNVKGLQWNNKYGYVAINVKNEDIVVDGMNERGLVVGVLLFPGFASFQPFNFDQKKTTLSSIDLSAYLLGNFDNVQQIKFALKNIQVVYNKDIHTQLDNLHDYVHYTVTDDSGQSIVIEYTRGKLHIHDNEAKVLTNAPEYHWQLLNLRNYPQLQIFDRLERHKTKINLSPFGRGSGLIGLPGDFSSPSRFIRAFFYAQHSIPLHTHAQAVNQAKHILSSFDIPDGSVIDGNFAKNNIDYTQWSTIADLKKRIYHYWTHSNHRIRMVNLNKLNFSPEMLPREIPLDYQKAEDIEDITNRLNKSKKSIVSLTD